MSGQPPAIGRQPPAASRWNDTELYCESHGSGAPLVLLGGLGLDVSEMGMLTGPVAGRFQVIAVDNRGTSRSAKPPGPYSIEQMAADVAGLMNRLDLPRSHLLGISMGGRIATALALAQPGRFNRGQACRSPTRLHVPVPSPRLINAPRGPRLRGGITGQSARFPSCEPTRF